MTFDKGRALVVGISHYNEVGSLPEAVLNDARDIASVLQSAEYCGFLPQNTRTLLDDQATLDAIRNELANLASSCSPDDTVIVFFSGHGARLGSGPTRTSALIPVDCRTSNIQDTTLGETELSAALAKIKARRLLVLLDACHAGGAGSLKWNDDTEVQLGFEEKSFDRLAQGTGRVIIASSRANETSRVMNGASNSLFTEWLLEALRGKARPTGDGLIRVFDIFNYVSEHVRRTVPGLQHPIFKANDLEDNFPVALDRGGVKGPASVQSVPVHWRQIEQIMADLYPAGPGDQEIWARAGGDVSRLRLSGTGRTNWFSALRILRLGGGGEAISLRALLDTALGDFPHHPELAALIASAP